MKLTGIFLLATVLQVSAHSMAQTVTYEAKNTPLSQVFSALEKQTGCVFFYEKQDLQRAGPVSVNLQGVSLKAALETILADQPLAFTIQGNTIAITRKEKAVSQDTVPRTKSETTGGGVMASGVVVNEFGQPLSGASVMVLETKKSTITNAKGEFKLEAPVNGTVVISYIGYTSQKIKYKESNYVGIKMEVSNNELDKAVVQAYGQTNQRLSTGDIVVVSAAEIEKQPVMNPLMALQGRVAGLDIQSTSGYASGPIRATIRGMSSVDPYQVPDPLYVVDGVPLTVLNIGSSQNYATGSYGFLQNAGLTGPANGQSPLFSINPNDIESISVLKDADATSIYGSRGANGVILITTKSGKPGKTHFSIHFDEGVNKVTRHWKMLNTPQYLAMRREAFKNDGITPTVGNAPDLLVWDTTRSTDWQKALYGKAGKVKSIDLGLTGGDVHTTFRIGASYMHSASITTASGAEQRASLTFSLDHHSSNQKLSVGLKGGYDYTQSDLIQFPGRITYAPNAPSIYDSSGKLNWKQWDATFAGATGANPFGVLLQPYTAKTGLLNGSLELSYQPIRGLTLSTLLGYNVAQDNQLSLQPIASQDPASQPTAVAQFGNNSNKNWNIDPQISYSAPIGPGTISVLMGGSLVHNTTDGIYIYGYGYNNDALLRTISNAPNQVARDNYGEYRYGSVFGRLGYNIGDKYVIDFNVRRDGSSNYGPGHEFGNFASVGAIWIFTEESWFKDHFSFLSFGKLQGSYGNAGSDGGKPYGYITRWTSNGLMPYTGIEPVIATQHANPNYQWQQSRKLEASINLGFFKDWITVRTSYYRSRTNNQLLAYPTPIFSGFSSVLANLPALVQNQGWEFTFGGRGVHTKYFSWAPNINLTFNQNKFLSFPGLGSSPYRNNGFIGKPLNGAYLLHSLGVDPKTGQYAYQDRDHDGIINNQFVPPTGGDVYFKKLNPAIQTGFGFNFDLKGFDLSLQFYVKKQTGVNAIAQGLSPGTMGNNQPVDVLARWQKPGDRANVGKFSTNGGQDPNGYITSSDIGYTDASFIRLQNLSLSYNFPEAYAKRAGMQSFTLFIHANNIFVITDYKGIDPETQFFGGLPPTRTIVGGLSINF